MAPCALKTIDKLSTGLAPLHLPSPDRGLASILAKGRGVLRFWYRQSLLTRFTVTGLALTSAAGFLLGSILGWQLEHAALAQEADNAADQVSIVDAFLRREDFDSPVAPDRYAAIDSAIRRGVPLQGHMAQVKIWNRSGVVIYSTAAEAAGQQFAISDELAEALGGQVANEISDLSKQENLTERGSYQRLMEIYVPIRLSGEIVGAYEVYHSFAVVEPHIAAIRRSVWASVGLAFAMLYLGLYSVVRRASGELRRQSEELGRLEAQREMDRLRNEFVNIVSHEFRTPLTTVLGFSELLLSRQVAEAQRQQWIGAIHDDAVRLRGLVEDLLDLSRIQEGRIELHPEAVDVGSVVDRVLAGFRAQTTVHFFEHRLQEPIPPVYADPNKLIQILTNLVSNAVKYSPKGGAVTIAANSLGDKLHLSVTDQGLGIPPTELPHLFERFHRIDDDSRRNIRGTGLGLYITRQLVDLQAGRIWVESGGPGRGSTFHLELPVASPVAVGV